MHQVAAQPWMACGELHKNIYMSISWREYADIRTAHEHRIHSVARVRDNGRPNSLWCVLTRRNS